MTIDPKNLPHDLEGCWALLRQVLEELQRVQLLSEKQKHQIGQLLRARYGQRSDRFQDPNQLQLAIFEAMKETTPAPEPPAPKPEPSAKPRRRGHGRRPLPAELPRERVVHALPSAELTCPNCSRQRAKIREETVEQLEYVHIPGLNRPPIPGLNRPPIPGLNRPPNPGLNRPPLEGL